MELPKNERRALGDLEDVRRVVELGNKKNTTGVYRDWYERRGLEYVSIDWNGEDGALPLDMRLPISCDDIGGVGDIVTNFGFSEHVAEQEACWRNIHGFVGKRLCCVTPEPGFWRSHGIPSGFPGIWYPSSDWYRDFADLNGYVMEDIWVDSHLVCCRMRKEFRMPAGMYENRINDSLSYS